jgi:hypothetical protein
MDSMGLLVSKSNLPFTNSLFIFLDRKGDKSYTHSVYLIVA